MNIHKPIFLFALFCAAASGATLFMGAYPDSVIVFDEGKGQVVDKINLTTGLPISMRLSLDHKKIYVTTNDSSGLEVIDAATHKVTSHFVLNTPTKRFRFNGGVPDPQDKLFYAVTTEMNKLNDRYEIGKPKYTVIDLGQMSPARTRMRTLDITAGPALKSRPTGNISISFGTRS
jgi:DNA-binding beta-propeller fold protein YncE